MIDQITKRRLENLRDAMHQNLIQLCLDKNQITENYELDLKRNELLTEQDKIMDSIITTSESIKKRGGVNSLLELKDFLESLSKYHAVYQDGHAYIREIE